MITILSHREHDGTLWRVVKRADGYSVICKTRDSVVIMAPEKYTSLKRAIAFYNYWINTTAQAMLGRVS